MALTRGFGQTVADGVQREPEFATVTVDEAASPRLSLDGEPNTSCLPGSLLRTATKWPRTASRNAQRVAAASSPNEQRQRSRPPRRWRWMGDRGDVTRAH